MEEGTEGTGPTGVGRLTGAGGTDATPPVGCGFDCWWFSIVGGVFSW